MYSRRRPGTIEPVIKWPRSQAPRKSTNRRRFHPTCLPCVFSFAGLSIQVSNIAFVPARVRGIGDFNIGGRNSAFIAAFPSAEDANIFRGQLLSPVIMCTPCPLDLSLIAHADRGLVLKTYRRDMDPR